MKEQKLRAEVALKESQGELHRLRTEIAAGKYISIEEVKEIIVEQLDIEEALITEEASFKDDLGIDSLDLFELVMALEEEFNVEIPSEDLESVVTVQDIMDYLKGKGISQ